MTTPATVAARIASTFGRLPQVEAVAMAGSQSAGAGDGHSDVDLYVYSTKLVAIADRDAIAAAFATRREMGDTFWEAGDEWIDARTGIHVDVMYRTPAWIEEQLDRVLIRHEASLGYSTCFWYNVLHSTPLFDRTAWYRDLQKAASRSYPEPLKRAIIAKNHPILRQSLSSYLTQIKRAVHRGDSVSVQHRVAALLASYFDILFAVNELPHPGEKRLLHIAATRCAITPPDMKARVNALLETAARPATAAVVVNTNALLAGLDQFLADEGLLPP